MDGRAVVRRGLCAAIEAACVAVPLPAAGHLAMQVARADPNDGAGALALFRSNRFTGLLLFLGLLVVGLSSLD